nr:MAG TPA: hypothetical protein [Caudoviricetes sp.]
MLISFDYIIIRNPLYINTQKVKLNTQNVLTITLNVI